MISFIVSVYDRPWNLKALVPLLVSQHGHSETLICDNFGSAESDVAGTQIYRTGEWGAGGCYESANMVCERGIPQGDWLCFPSDDSLYVSQFGRIMLETASREKAELVYCDCVYKQGTLDTGWPAYSVLNVSARMGRIDKTCFIVKRELFKGFPPHPQDYRDGALIEELVKRGVRHAKAPGVLVVHQ